VHIVVAVVSHEPDVVLQDSVVHALLSSHVLVDVVSHAPVVALHTSCVQGLLSSQVVVWLVSQAPVVVLQASVVHALLSSQVVVLEVSQVPVAALQDSVVHALLSLQTTGVFVQASVPIPFGSQVSVVHLLLSSHELTKLVLPVEPDSLPAVSFVVSCVVPPV
jgi:hypothetical protein